MGRQDGHLGGGQVEEQGEDRLVGRILGAGAADASLLAILEGRRVAVVAVGDDDRPGLGQGDEPVGRATIAARAGCHDPETMAHAVVIHDIRVRSAGHHRVEERPALPVQRRVEADHRAEVGAGRREQRQPVRAWAAHRALVRQDAAAWTERLEREACEEASLPAFGARAWQPVRLLVGVERWREVLAQRAVGAPGHEGRGGPPVSIVGPIAGLGGGQVEQHRVARMPARQPPLQLGRDDVIRRADDVGEVADGCRVVAQGAEWSQRGHGRPMVAAMARTCPARTDAGRRTAWSCNFTRMPDV